MVSTFFVIESRVHSVQRHESSDQQRRAHQQNHRQPDFTHHQRRASLVLLQSRSRPSAALFQCDIQIRRSIPARPETIRKRCRSRAKSPARSQHPPVDPQRDSVLAHARHPGRIHREERPNARVAQRQSQRAARQRKQHALGQQLPDDAARVPLQWRRGWRFRAFGPWPAPAADSRRSRTRSAAPGPPRPASPTAAGACRRPKPL